jgi:hypothetical protein
MANYNKEKRCVGTSYSLKFWHRYLFKAQASVFDNVRPAETATTSSSLNQPLLMVTNCRDNFVAL